MNIKDTREWLSDLRGAGQFGKRSCFTNALQLLKPWQHRIYSTILKLPSGKLKFQSPTQRQLHTAIREFTLNRNYYLRVSKLCSSTERYNILDIGANIGYYTAALCSTNETLKVFSFEPDRRNLFFLSLNLASALNAVIINAGLSDTNEYKKLEIPGYALSRHGEAKFNTGLLSAAESPTSVNGAAFLNGEEVLATYAVTPGATGWIKIDVEGYEEKVLRSLRRFINASPAVIQFEYNPNFINSKSQIDFIVNFIQENRMTAYIDHEPKQLFEKGRLGIPRYSCDIYLVKHNIAAEFEAIFDNLVKLPVM